MQKLNLKDVPKNLKPNPIFKGLPSKLKDVSSFEKVEKQLFDVLQSDHKHKTVKSYLTCPECQTRIQERKKTMKKIGFKSLSQYLEWKKVITIIKGQKSFQLK